MIPEPGDKIRWRLGLHHDKQDHYNTVVKVEPCQFSQWFTTFFEVWLDNGQWIREQDVLEIIDHDNNRQTKTNAHRPNTHDKHGNHNKKIKK